MQSNSHFEFGSICLGAYGNIASWRRCRPGSSKNWTPSLCILTGSASEDGAFIPASDVTISTVEGLVALRSAIDEALKYVVPQRSVQVNVDESIYDVLGTSRDA